MEEKRFEKWNLERHFDDVERNDENIWLYRPGNVKLP